MAARTWTLIEALFLEAIELPAGERARFLDRACASDLELRAEVESLLEKDECRDDAIADALAKEAALLFKPQVLSGERLGAYRVLHEIGRGGMGSVYLAERDDEHYRQQVAVKLVKRGMDTTEVLRRFRRERQILASLEHPYIARLLDGGTSSDGRPFLVMELVEGTPVDVYAKEHALGVEDRCRLFLKVCEAVSYAHRKLVVHRDLKPRNILVAGAKSGDSGCPKLLDFGLAKLLAPEIDPDAPPTGVRNRLLTPDYASPEQIRGDPLTTATDIYSLGVVLYELLTGVRPHSSVSLDPNEWLKAVFEREVARPSALCASERLRQRLAGDLDNILMKALRKEADRRYRSVDEFAADIRAYLECRPVAARPDSSWYRTAKFLRRRRYPLLAAAAAFAALVSGTGIAVMQNHDAQIARRMAEIRQQEAQQAGSVAESEHARAEWQRDSAVKEQRRAEDRMAQMLSLSERSLSDVYTLMERLPGAGPARRELIVTTLDFLRKLSKDAGSDMRFRVALAKAYLHLGDLEVDPGSDRAGALASYQSGLALIDGSWPEGTIDRERLLVWLNLQRQISSLLQDSDPAAASARQHACLRELDRLPAATQAEPELVRARAMIDHGLATASHGDLPRARGYASSYLSAIAKLAQHNPDDPELTYELSTAHVELGWLLWAMGDPEATAIHYQKAVELREHLAASHPTDMLYRRTLMLAYEHLAAVEGGGLVNSLGRPDVARDWYRKALPLAEASSADPNNTVAAIDYANLLLRMASVDVPAGGLEESLAMLRKAAGLFETLQGASGVRHSNDAYLVDAYTMMGQRLRAMGNYPGAIAQYQRALSTAGAMKEIEETAPETVQRAMEAEAGMAIALTLSGDRSGALDSITRLRARAAAHHPDRTVVQSPEAQAHLASAEVHRALGEVDAAREEADRALESLPAVAAGAWDPNARIVREAQAVAARSVSARQ